MYQDAVWYLSAIACPFSSVRMPIALHTFIWATQYITDTSVARGFGMGNRSR